MDRHSLRRKIQPVGPAKNWTYEPARKQTEYFAQISAEKWLNSIEVEGFNAEYYRHSRISGRNCTCQVHHPSLETSNISIPLGEGIGYSDKTRSYTIDTDNPLFAPSAVDMRSINNKRIGDIPIENEADIIGDTGYVDRLFEYGVDCGICYRTGYQPGYDKVGWYRHLSTSLTILAGEFYHVNSRSSPNTIELLTNASWVEFELHIPKYYSSVKAVGYNNIEHIPGFKLTDNLDNAVDPAWLDANKGTMVRVRVHGGPVTFTHFVIEFKLPIIRELKVSLPQISSQKDFTRFLGLPSVSIIFGNLVGRCNPDDIVYLSDYGYAWRIISVEPLLVPSSKYNIGWQTQSRIIQPIESLNRIAISKINSFLWV